MHSAADTVEKQTELLAGRTAQRRAGVSSRVASNSVAIVHASPISQAHGPASQLTVHSYALPRLTIDLAG